MMARSSYIYVVLSADETPMGAFTVRWEAQAFVNRERDMVTDVIRIPDGDYLNDPSHKITWITVEAFIG